MRRLPENIRKKIKPTFKQTGSIRKTSKILGISRNTVRTELRGNSSASVPASKPRLPSKLDPFKAKIQYLVKEKDLSGVRTLEEIQELGYTGGYSILKDYIRTFRPKKIRGPTTPIDHQVGYEGQMDWSPHRVILGGREETTHTGSIVLCFSRWLHLQFFTDEKIESVIRLHEEAFERMGGVPETMTYDNMTTVGMHVGPNKVWINPTFKAFGELSVGMSKKNFRPT